ncbi:MAG TPA: glucose-6-phosphate isomerase [Hyphomicrobiaceae bacterium]|nr:glucose-6-phosphate isomerase [Hyphomicrobiaceae bacterium]
MSREPATGGTAPSTQSIAPYTQSIDGCLEAAIGKHGLAPTELGRWLDPLVPALAALQADYRSRQLPHLRIAEETADVTAAQAALARLSEGAETIVFFGIGGSSLGGQTLAQLGGWNIPGMADAAQRRRPRTRFYDNLDPVTLQSALGAFDLAATRFVVTSKSGSTPETLVQALAALAAAKDAGLAARLPELFLGITEPAAPGKPNGLRALLEAHAIPILDHHPGIGGRYSVFTNVGLLPAMARGLDALAVRAGGRNVIAALMAAKSPREFAPALGAAVVVGMARERGVRVQVMMPYADRLGRLGHWFAQLWAESLGKNGQGTAPIAALGPADQHSQLQLFMDGPREYLVHVVRAPSAGLGPRISPLLASAAGLGYLAGRTAGDLVAAQAAAVPEALQHAGRPVRVFDLAGLDERSVGALMMHFMLETILAARLMGVDPFDQPAVELAKVMARERVAAL